MPAKGGGLESALWTGTAFFAASKASSFTGFLKSFAKYAVVLIILLMIMYAILKALGIRVERFTAPTCAELGGQETVVSGQRGCLSASGNWNALLSS